ncbi:hypothetical protein KCX83_03690 [Brucella oryzae]|uniref:hypothetical protein n=1 Tax=Brucella oryzae TaxID=335286 RepID=UPI001B84198B|nr:hypothetical protein [Brucella oryzae]MBR7651421.1 hypothetical protein [Brucella oryzae]
MSLRNGLEVSIAALCAESGFDFALNGSDSGFRLRGSDSKAGFVIGQFKPFERSAFALAQINCVNQLVDQFR